jgi:hypothetical protein
MQESIHIAVTLLIVILLVRPFDCVGSGKFTAKSAECCKKGKCNPSNGDDCCKGTLPGGKQLVLSKAPHHATPAVDLAATVPQAPIAPTLTIATATEIPAPPGSPPSSRVNLPLLV